MHTSEVSKCGMNTAAQQVRSYKRRGYAGMIVTDHFINGYCACPRHLSWDEKMHFIMRGYLAAKEEGDKCDFDVFLGWEFSYHGLDFLTYGLGLDFLLANPNFDRLEPEDYSRLVRASGGYIAQAHPYRDRSYIVNQTPIAPEFLDGVEVFNSSDPHEINAKAKAFAKKHGLPMQAGSDSHGVDLRLPSGISLRHRAKSIEDIILAIKDSKVELIEY